MPISRSSAGRQETARDRVRLAPPDPQSRLGREERPVEEWGRSMVAGMKNQRTVGTKRRAGIKVKTLFTQDGVSKDGIFL